VTDEKIQAQFVDLLKTLTVGGKVEWARASHEPGFVYALAHDEYIVFELRGGQNAKLVTPDSDVAGIVCKCRNVTYLWLQPNDGFVDLLHLLQDSPIDDAKFLDIRKRAYYSPVKALEALRRKLTLPQ